jgi:hypothetical protein
MTFNSFHCGLLPKAQINKNFVVRIGQRPAKKAGRVYGGNARLAGSGSNRTGVKNGQGGQKLFFGLIFFGYFFVSRQKSNSLRGLSGTDRRMKKKYLTD